MNGKENGRFRGVAMLALATLVATAPASLDAQTRAASQGWTPYLGCWEPQGADVEEGVLCFVEGTTGVEMLTLVDGEVAYREPFQADGRPHEIEQEGCNGTESAWFSADLKRLYTLSDVSCEGDAPRRTTGIISMPERGLWLDVRASETDDETLAWSRWYQRTGDRVLEEAGVRPSRHGAIFGTGGPRAAFRSAIAVDDVVDASRNVHAKAVSAWIAEVGQEFRGLDGDDLIRLDDEGVDADVIDVVVAVSFPDRFSVTAGGSLEEAEDAGIREPAPRAGRFGFIGYDPYYYGYGYSPFWSSRYSHYSPFGYYGSPFGYYGGWWGGRTYVPIAVDVNPTTRAPGRVVAGKGYRPGYQRDRDAPSGRAAGGSMTGRPSKRPLSPPSRSGGSSGRKAKPRGGK